MTIENMSEGIKIFVGHGLTGYCIAAEHDVIYFGNAREAKMPLKTIRKLYKLGFFIDKEFESWSAFV